MNVNNLKRKSINFTIVKQDESPVCCPPKYTQIWNMHPKVFLHLNDNGKAVCPYCGERYELE